MPKFYRPLTALALGLTVLGLSVIDADARGRRSTKDKEDTRTAPSEELRRTSATRPWYFYYLQGKEFEAKGNWKRAKENYLLAIEADPESALNKRITKNDFTDYIPYYRLANAYYNLGQVAEAEKYLKIEEQKKIAPPDLIGSLWQLIIEGRDKPQVYLYSLADVEKTSAAFVDIKGIAYDAHNIDRIEIRQGNHEATVDWRAVKSIDEEKALPYNPTLRFEPQAKIYFEALSFPLQNYGENRIQIRAFATNPERASDIVEVTIFRDKPKSDKPKEAEAAQ